MAEYRNRDCMFCGEEMPVTAARPVNLAFMDHIRRRDDCREQWIEWTRNMHADFKGD